jgi:hypothetical protein
MGTTASPCPSVALADSDSKPLFRFRGNLSKVLLEEGWLDNPKFFNPGRSRFVIICQSMNGHLECEIVGGPQCGLYFLLSSDFFNDEVFWQFCERA